MLSISCLKLFKTNFYELFKLLSVKKSTLTPNMIKAPPLEVKGLKKWTPEAFNKTIQIPHIRLNNAYISLFKKLLGNFIIKLPNFPHLIESEISDCKEIRLDPDLVKTIEDLPKEKIDLLEEKNCKIELLFKECHLTYKNWRTTQLLDAVLRDLDNSQGFKSYSIIGHIAHLNLKEENLPYKDVIANIILSSMERIKTVVNKANNIDNKFRNFQMDVLAGDDQDFTVTVKENKCTFQMDFSKVFWNPRLTTEHERLVKMLKRDDVLFDVFAGVGPFSVPAAKISSHVYANDLNPHSYEWLKKNFKLNKISDDRYTCSNLDGREFIRNILGSKLKEINKECEVHVTMNLPALAIEFLDSFADLFDDEESCEFKIPLVHVYSFTKDIENPHKDLQERCETSLGTQIENCEFNFVRRVAPNKDMYRISFRPSVQILCKKFKENNSKRLKTS